MGEIFQADLFMLEFSFPYFPIKYLFIPDLTHATENFILFFTKGGIFNINFKKNFSSIFL